MKKHGKILLAFMLALSLNIGNFNAMASEVSSIEMSQEKKDVKGVVLDENGQPLPGVSVSIKGTNRGVNTSIDGKWELSVLSTDILEFSFMGMKTQFMKVGAKTTFKIILEEDRVDIDEVMVVAYGTATKKSFTGSAATVNNEKIEAKNVSEISKALSGEIAGVNVINSSGQPGTQATIRIRGFGSVNASSSPLYIVDGVAYDGDISAISPSDIKSTTVLKDASATSIYGSRGSNGVILITTKTGKKGKTKISAEFKYGVNMKLLPQYNVMKNQEHYVETAWEALRNKKIIDGFANYKGDDDFSTYYQNNLSDANAYASQNIFNKKIGFDEQYNMWNQVGNTLIDPTTGRFNSGINRKYTPESWEDNIFNTGQRTETNVKISGGDDKTTFFSSIGYLKDEGYYINSDFQRLNTRLSLNHQVRPWLKTTTNMSYSYMESNKPGQTGGMNNGFAFVNQIPSIYPVFQRDADGKKTYDKKLGRNVYDYNFGKRVRRFASGINPAGSVRLDKDKTISHQIVANGMVDAKINEDFSFNSTFGVQIYIGNNGELSNPFYGDSAGKGSVYKDNQITTSYTWNQLLKYRHTFDNIHNVDAFIAHEVTSYENNVMYGGKSKIVRGDIMEWNNAIIMDYLGSYTNSYFLESFFAQAKYDYDNKYFIHGTIRRDGTSRFPNNKWGTFGSIGLAWVVSSEEFMADVEVIKDLKLKASYGTLGNQDLYYNGYSSYYPTRDTYKIENLDDEISFVRDYKGNNDLTWEHSNSFNLGASFKLSNWAEIEFDYFRKNTTNLLFFKKVARSLGYSKIPVNDGELLNEGLEFNTLFHVVKNDNFQFDFSLNGAHYNNEMLKMPMEGEGHKVLDLQGIFAYAQGHSLRDFYMREWAGVDSNDGRAQWNRYYYINNDGEEVTIKSMPQHKVGKYKNEKIFLEKTKDYANATKKFVGKSAIPDLAGAFSFDFSYKNFSLSTQFLYSVGGYAYDSSYAGLMNDMAVGSCNWHTDMNNRWQKPGDVSDNPRLSSGSDLDANSTSTRFLIKNNYITLNNIKLSYTIPTSLLEKINIPAASFSVSGDNLWLLSGRKGYTPNMSTTGTSDAYDYTPLSSVTCSLKINF